MSYRGTNEYQSLDITRNHQSLQYVDNGLGYASFSVVWSIPMSVPNIVNGFRLYASTNVTWSGSAGNVSVWKVNTHSDFFSINSTGGYNPFAPTSASQSPATSLLPTDHLKLIVALIAFLCLFVL